MTVPSPYPADWVRFLETGTPPADARFPSGHYHSAEELHTEVESSGLEVLDVVGIEGPAGIMLESVATSDSSLSDAALTLARAAGGTPGVRDFSSHLLAIARVPLA